MINVSKKFLVGSLVSLAIFFSVRTMRGQQQPNPHAATVQDIYKNLGVCITNYTKDEEYIQSLEAANSNLQKDVLRLSEEVNKLQHANDKPADPAKK